MFGAVCYSAEADQNTLSDACTRPTAAPAKTGMDIGQAKFLGINY